MNCIFCDRKFRKVKNSNQPVTTTTLFSKKEQIHLLLQDLNLQEKVDQNENAESICYHTSCLSERLYNYMKIHSPKKPTIVKQSAWSSKRTVHSVAFSKLAVIINETLCERDGVRALSDIYANYEAIFNEEKRKLNAEEFDYGFKQHHLLKKILEHFPNLTKTVYKQRTFVHKDSLSFDRLCAIGFEGDNDLMAQIKSVAFRIREIMLGLEKCDLPKTNLTLEDILKGECDVPKELHLLIECLLKGPNGSKSSIKEKKIESISQSIMYCASNGLMKPALPVWLALATKSLTGSRKMIEILNRMGYSISYTLAAELETELAFGYAMQKRLLPNGLIANSQLRTHLAFDNYDRKVETPSGKDTLHDTVAIVYQNIIKDVQAENEPVRTEAPTDPQSITRRRKYYSQFDSSVAPYFRGNRVVQELKGSVPVLPFTLNAAEKMDTIWMLNHALDTSHDRWFFWNSQRVFDLNPVQKIGYLPNINMSPTSDAVVKKTLEIAQVIANECNQQHIVVTYDLAIACKAYKIKSELSPQFDNVFVTMGAFHAQMSYFKVSSILVNILIVFLICFASNHSVFLCLQFRRSENT